jgi:hypothetical protein
MMLGAACLADQNQDFFLSYHRAAMAADAPWDAEQIVEAVKGFGADMDRFRACLADDRRKTALTNNWHPEDMTRNDLLSRIFVDGKSSSKDVIACDSARPESMDVKETLSCLERLVARLEESAPRVSAAAPIQVTFLSGGQEKPMSSLNAMAGHEFMALERASHFLSYSDYVIDLYFNPTDLVRIGPLDGRTYTGEARIIDGDLYLVTKEPTSIRVVSLPKGTSDVLIVEGGAWIDQDETLAYFGRHDNRLYYLSCLRDSPNYQPEGWKLRRLDTTTGEVELLANWDKFELYSGPSDMQWDDKAGRLLMTVAGGDGGISWKTVYAIDEALKKAVLVRNDIINYSCAEATETNVYCTSEEIESVKAAMISDERLDYLKSHGCDDGAKGNCRCGGLVIPKPQDLGAFMGCYE